MITHFIALVFIGEGFPNEAWTPLFFPLFTQSFYHIFFTNLYTFNLYWTTMSISKTSIELTISLNWKFTLTHRYLYTTNRWISCLCYILIYITIMFGLLGQLFAENLDPALICLWAFSRFSRGHQGISLHIGQCTLILLFEDLLPGTIYKEIYHWL